MHHLPIGGKYYIHGGYGESGLRGDLWSYDPSSNQWSEESYTNDGPEPRQYHCMITYEDAVYLYGGEGFMVFWKFTPGSRNTWEELSSGPEPLSHGDMAFYTKRDNTMLVLFGGKNSAGEVMDETWEFDLDLEQWEQHLGTKEYSSISSDVHLNNFPNPWRENTEIIFTIPSKSRVEIDMYNLKGKKIHSLASGTYSKCIHKLSMNRNSLPGRIISSGYILKK